MGPTPPCAPGAAWGGDFPWRLPEACLRAFPTVHKATKYLPLNPISTKDILNPCTHNQRKFRSLAADPPRKIPLGPGLTVFISRASCQPHPTCVPHIMGYICLLLGVCHSGQISLPSFHACIWFNKYYRTPCMT